MSQTHWKQLTNPDYLGAYSLLPGQELTVEIVRVERKQVTGADGKKEECTVAILKDQKPMILNSTNCKTLSKIYGTPYIEEWAGKSVIIHSEKVKAFGDVVDALRIKPTKPILPELTPTHPAWNEAAKAVKAGKIDKVLARYSVSGDNIKKLNA
jgi:hypothetical protein